MKIQEVRLTETSHGNVEPMSSEVVELQNLAGSAALVQVEHVLAARVQMRGGF